MNYFTLISPRSYHPSSCRPAIPKRIAGFLVRGSRRATAHDVFPALAREGRAQYSHRSSPRQPLPNVGVKCHNHIPDFEG